MEGRDRGGEGRKLTPRGGEVASTFLGGIIGPV